MRAKKKLAEKKKTYEESKAHRRRCPTYTLSDQKAQMLLGNIQKFLYIDIAHHSATCSANCYDMTRMQVHGKSRMTRPVLFPCESTADFGIAGEGRSSIEEKSTAKFRRTSGASRHVVPQHATTSISAIVWRQ